MTAVAEWFSSFLDDAEPRLRMALVASSGQQRGLEATAEALAYWWEHRERLEPMDEWMPIPAGQLPGSRILDTVALGDGFLAEGVWPSQSATYWHSSDGVQWSAIEAGGGLDGLLPWGDIVVAQAMGSPSDEGALPAYQLTAAGSQLDVDLSRLSVFGFYPAVAAGEVGLAGVSPTGHPSGDTPEDGTLFVDYSRDGLTWTRRTLPFSAVGSRLLEAVANVGRVLVRADGDLWIGAPS